MDQHSKVIDELLRAAKTAARVDRERIELFEKMITTPAWQAYVELLNAKIQMFADEVLRPSAGVDECVALEYVKGAMSGLIIARDTPAATIAAKDQLRATGPSEEDEDVDDA